MTATTFRFTLGSLNAYFCAVVWFFRPRISKRRNLTLNAFFKTGLVLHLEHKATVFFSRGPAFKYKCIAFAFWMQMQIDAAEQDREPW